MVRCQFNQHFTKDFFANIFLPKNCKAKTELEKSCAKHFSTKKRACKMLMKLTMYRAQTECENK